MICQNVQVVNEAMFGMNEEQISELGLTWGIAIFIGFMLFIIWDLARKSGAGKLGTFVLFFVLAFGMLGFIAKQVIKWMMGL
jgi:hypothetical protein